MPCRVYRRARDQIGAGQVERLDAVRLAIREQFAAHLAHALDFLDVVKTPRRLAERIGALEIEQLPHEPRRVHAGTREPLHLAKQADAIGVQGAIMVVNQKARVADELV